eukprot:4487864-Amphidinium_carterae.1
MARILYRASARPAGPEMITSALKIANDNPEHASPLWRSWLQWVHTFGGTVVEGNVILNDRVVLHQ